jgi:hypothetical protein
MRSKYAARCISSAVFFRVSGGGVCCRGVLLIMGVGLTWSSGLLTLVRMLCTGTVA